MIALPFASLIIDVASWYLTKLWEGFAWVVIGSGVAYSFAFAFMWVSSMYQMWLYRLPEEIAEEGGRLPRLNV
ncbi:MAG: hypothetical protein ACUVT2_03995 [Thiobacillaceae bacterium]